MLAPPLAFAQSRDPAPEPPGAPAAGTAISATLHGSVVDAATGDPLPRALVRLVGDESGVLTDGEGRYEIAGVAAGPQQVEVLKPGYLDPSARWSDTREYAHTVVVAQPMPDVVFRMAPANSIHGVIRLSSGDPAQIGVTLLKRVIEDGRTAWRVAAQGATNLDGVYRFGRLSDGAYLLYTSPAMESQPPSNLIEPGRAANVERNGYASVFYPDAREFNGAGKIELRGGTSAEADLSLTLEPFRAVTVSPVLPRGQSDPGAEESSGMAYSAAVDDREGHHLPYPALFDAATHSLQAFLPQGLYLLVVNSIQLRMPRFESKTTGSAMASPVEEKFAGEIEVTVEDRAVSNLRVALAAVTPSRVEVNLTRTEAPASAGSGENPEHISILLNRTGDWMTGGMAIDYAEGSLGGALLTQNAEPGAYWALTNLSDRHLCVRSLVAGGVDLGREPLTVNIVGPAAPLTLNLRDDCARLTLTLPAAVWGAGEEPFYTVYAVPDADTTVDVVPETLRPSTGGKVTLEGLAPGAYHIYTFDQPVTLAYREHAVLDEIPHGEQSISLEPGSSASVVLEVPLRP